MRILNIAGCTALTEELWMASLRQRQIARSDSEYPESKNGQGSRRRWPATLAGGLSPAATAGVVLYVVLHPGSLLSCPPALAFPGPVSRLYKLLSQGLKTLTLFSPVSPPGPLTSSLRSSPTRGDSTIFT